MNIPETLGSAKIWRHTEGWNLCVCWFKLKLLYSKRFDRWQSNCRKPEGAGTQEMCVVHPSFPLLLFFSSASHEGYLSWELRADALADHQHIQHLTHPTSYSCPAPPPQLVLTPVPIPCAHQQWVLPLDNAIIFPMKKLCTKMFQLVDKRRKWSAWVTSSWAAQKWGLVKCGLVSEAVPVNEGTDLIKAAPYQVTVNCVWNYWHHNQIFNSSVSLWKPHNSVDLICREPEQMNCPGRQIIASCG